MLELKDKALCCGCTACAQACPKKCISMQKDKEGFLYPQIDREECVNCGLCERICPIANAHPEASGKPEVFSAYSKNEKQRLESSSGGIFSLLAEQVLKDGGVVFGAEMTEDCRAVRHIAVESASEMSRVRGSKYLQSDIGLNYVQAKAYLEANRKVLFSGTPCEIEGLKSFLRKDYENLLCVDVICHGVPSPRVWEKYISDRENCAGASARRVIFRDKKKGWKKYSVFFEFSNNTTFEQARTKNPFMRMFLQNLCLRPSCYECPFRKEKRISDITLADFWGYRTIDPEMDDNKGLSAVLLHSQKGSEAFEAIKSEIISKPAEVAQVLNSNPSLVRPCPLPPVRNEFMNQLDALSIDELARQYVKKTPLKAILIEEIRALLPRKMRLFLKQLLKKK